MKKPVCILIFIILAFNINIILLSDTIGEIKFYSMEDFTIISFNFSRKIDTVPRIFTLPDPERLYFDLRNINLSRDSNIMINDERIRLIRFGYPDPNILRIVLEINNFNASDINTLFEPQFNTLHLIVYNPGYNLKLSTEDIINKYALGIKTEDVKEIQDFRESEEIIQEKPVSEDKSVLPEPKAKVEENDHMKVKDTKKTIQGFLPAPVSNILFTEIFSNFYVLYLIIIALLVLMVLLIFRKKPKATSAIETETETEDDYEDLPAETRDLKEDPSQPQKDNYDWTAPAEEGEFANIFSEEKKNISRDLNNDSPPDAEEEEVQFAEIVEEKDEEYSSKDDLFTVKQSSKTSPKGEQHKEQNTEDSETPKEPPTELEQEIEDSLGIFDQAQTNKESEQDDDEIMIKIDEKALSNKVHEENLAESYRYYPLKVGNGWVWKYKNSLRKRMIVGRKDMPGKGEVFKIKETVRIGEHKKQTIWYIYKSKKGIIEKADQYKKKLLSFPIKLNNKWEDDSNNYEIISMNESINNFDNCIKIMVAPKDIPIKRFVYFKKDIGLIMDEAKEELIKYKIDGKEYSV